MTQERLAQILETNLARHIGWITAADAKAGFLLTLATAMLGLQAAVAPAYGRWTAAGVTFSTLSAALLLGSVGCVAATIFPRTTGPGNSLIFFGDVANHQPEHLHARFVSLADEEYVEDLIEQCRINAAIASKKHMWIRRSAALLHVAFIPWITATYISFADK